MTAGGRTGGQPADAGRFEAFVRQYQDMVFATAVRLLGNASDAEDVAQTVFMRAFQRFAELGPSPTAAGWLNNSRANNHGAQLFCRALASLRAKAR